MAEGYCLNAHLTAQKLCEAVGVDCMWTECDELEPIEKQEWLSLFAEVLMDHVMMATK